MNTEFSFASLASQHTGPLFYIKNLKAFSLKIIPTYKLQDNYEGPRIFLQIPYFNVSSLALIVLWIYVCLQVQKR